ncbi:MAG: hypothetical protein LBR22_02675 [Desulfovibrio sp.]|nr:hypothetical protein [Desulfovibrio sp.]
MVVKFTKKVVAFEIKVSKTGTKYSIRKKLNEAVDQMVKKNYLGSHKNAVLISIAIDSKQRCIAMAAIGADVYEFVPQKHNTAPPTFNKVNNLETFMKQISSEISKRKRK